MTTEIETSTIETRNAPPLLEIQEMTKRFGTFTALDHVALTLRPGTFHALLGENGAGKSTLVKCVMGFYTPTSGQVKLDGQACTIASPRDAQKYGIGMVYQHFTSVPAMTVAENLVIARSGGNLVINWKEESEKLSAFMQTSPFQLPLDALVGQLAAGEKQKLEILKLLYLKSKILILDEPTSVLTPNEADEILGLLREQVSAGLLSVLLISHKMREVTGFTDEITVLRRGKLAGTGSMKVLTVPDITEMMMGERREPKPVEKVTHDAPIPVLEVRDLHADKDNGLEAVSGINLNVRSGEIVGIAGISGNGQREFVEVLAGQRQPTAGEVLVNGERYQATRAQMYEHRVFVLPEEPLKNACVPHMSVAENLALRTFDRPPQSKGILLYFKAIRDAAQSLIQSFKIKTPTPETPIRDLSGGNVQRAVLARELSSDHIKLLITANPCFGLDFAAVEDIHGQILQARNRGVAVLLVSEDLDELLKLSDRILVISGGKFLYESSIDNADFNEIGRSMTGH
ncbi:MULTISPECIES: ABC transporter ATP-binding protein [Leptolyngbya]|uniref:ABC transporter ATP-binding protein n=1 Tax=Leptolyngbya boryana CZ1 TaxID=3060204 RepID=A0AA97AN47_LEPBY|nr:MULTISPECIES: ABC transporter ATP-binding protein [Leptolyngbya]MBN8561313.1 ABC transporter ATP-binding protein [Leptolyngbya sp. UWPOB_LEPTO1]MCY6490491.1 ABC transporter ATP-binding protein [Leptolyngbya sp. GGD]WNZ43734.1 ABC transporter ATP-binding protein [Leptolyngbya boryana CZ1]